MLFRRNASTPSDAPSTAASTTIGRRAAVAACVEADVNGRRPMSDAVDCADLDGVLTGRDNPGLVSLPVWLAGAVEAAYDAGIVR